MLSILGSLLSGLSWLLNLFSSSAAQKVGAQAQALKQSNSAVTASAAEAQAEASAPKSASELEGRLHDGSF